MTVKKLFHDQRGEGLITGLYTMLILTIVLFVGIDLVGYTATVWKLRNACAETLTIMKMENGYDSRTEQFFFDTLRIQKLEISQVSVSGTPKTVQRGDAVMITATAPYALRSLRPFNKELRLNISVEMWGLAQDFIREGDN